MRHRIAVSAAAVLLAASLAGCGGDEEKPEKAEPAASQPADLVEEPPAEETPVEEDLALGTAVETIGSGGTGALEVTPASVVYVEQANGEKPDNGLLAVVSVKLRPTNAVAAAEAAPAENGGWSWVAPDGQAIGAGEGNLAFMVVPAGFDAGGEIQPGTFQWASSVFDISQAQRGGTLMYVDGAGTAYRWKVPAQDTGPQVAELKKALAE